MTAALLARVQRLEKILNNLMDDITCEHCGKVDLVKKECDHQVCKHDEIVTEAYPRSNPPKKCEICGVLYR